jgi:DNA-binding NtrC family response regulator
VTPRLLGEAPSIRAARRLLRRVAPLRQTVLLQGETGTGKELAARLLHDEGGRPEGPFVAINCGAIPGHLAESELFGHQRGAFTGAHRDRNGAFVRADGGTLFLDEIGELPLALQAKLLRTLEVGTVLPVGAEQEVRVDARIVAATHRNLPTMVASGQLREDLVHRLTVLVVALPALRERRDDIPLLLRHFAALASRDLGIPVVVDRDAVARARAHEWPGNLRGLKNAVLRAAVHGDGRVTAETLCQRGPWSVMAAPGAGPGGGPTVTVPRGDFASMKRALLQQVVAEMGSIREAASLLDIPRSTLGNWLARGRAHDEATLA